ncbi:magnesium transporter MgtE N-terminal domain-containing protein [Actinacidiphila bryophytorum]|nr:hypothetical protein [Actinacidiphila bryophytorum]MBM9438449.1 hypothetical protein [Actinacidiphila bryophytorum]MBN6547409.1 hypothetical protein [Actinacidiphila bryophytorum]
MSTGTEPPVTEAEQVLASLARLAAEEALAPGWGEVLAALADARLVLLVDRAAATAAAHALDRVRGRPGPPTAETRADAAIDPVDAAVAESENRARASEARYVQLAQHALTAASGECRPIPLPADPTPGDGPRFREPEPLHVPGGLLGYPLHRVRALSLWPPGALRPQVVVRPVEWADAVCLALAGELWAAGAVGLIEREQAVVILGRTDPGQAAEILDRMDYSAAAEILARMDSGTAAEILAQMDPESAGGVVSYMGDATGFEALDRMDQDSLGALDLTDAAEYLAWTEPARAAQLMFDKPGEVAAELLHEMDQDRAAEVLRRMMKIDELHGIFVEHLLFDLWHAHEAGGGTH